MTRDALAANSRKVLLISGFATEVVVLRAALDAMRAGFQAQVLTDASGGMSERTEQAALEQLAAAGSLTTSVVSVATKLAPDFTTDGGKQMFALVQQLRLP